MKALETKEAKAIKPEEYAELLQKINNLEVEILTIPSLKSQLEESKAKSALIPGLKAKIKALEAIDINFIKGEAKPEPAPAMMKKEESEPAPAMMKKEEKPEPVIQTKPTESYPAKLYFQSGSSHFPTDNDKSLDQLIGFLNDNPSTKVSVSGFHDASGSANWNRRLANKRSNRVKQIILDAGIAADRIEVAEPTETLGTGSPEEARRVEVELVK